MGQRVTDIFFPWEFKGAIDEFHTVGHAQEAASNCLDAPDLFPAGSTLNVSGHIIQEFEHRIG